MQTGESVIMGEADLQDSHVTLQELLLVDNQVSPTAADSFHSGGGEVKAGPINVVRTQTSAFEEGLLCSGQVTVVGDNQFDVWVGGHHTHEYWHPGSRIRIGGVI